VGFFVYRHLGLLGCNITKIKEQHMVKKSYLAKKDKELKLEVIKKINPKLYDKVKAGEMEIQDAYVQTMMRMK